MTTVYIPLDQSESAELIDPNTILPKSIYENLLSLIEKAVETVPDYRISRHERLERSHKAVSIDGERGSGKTSILVNLRGYIEGRNKQLLSQVHILDPIDPTLLEDGESLFLHVIVAAILHDESIKKAQTNNIEDYKAFSQSLERLANALESVDAQEELSGMDKIRSLYGNKHLVDCVTDFFGRTLSLLDKKLLVLPIDDVDTSLNRAFENLEIIRRYLVAPCVLPIVSGDRKLYDEVCWRDFHGRLTKDSSFKESQAFDIAQDLSTEYQRKILPLPRRLSMPSVESYWNDPNIKLGSNSKMSLRGFVSWLDIFIAGPVNGLEGSKVSLPLPSVRALTQFIVHCGALIEDLPENLCDKDDPLKIKRVWQMSAASTGAVEYFMTEYQRIHAQPDRDYKSAYKAFADMLENSPKEDDFALLSHGLVSEWVSCLKNYFQHEPKASVINLILDAKQHWLDRNSNVSNQTSVFSTPLFLPLCHSEQFKPSDLSQDLFEWNSHLKERLPDSWSAEIKNKKTALPYPVVEIGANSALNWNYWDEIEKSDSSEKQKEKAIFLISILCHRNYYTNNKRTMLLNIGRLFEIVISSLVLEPKMASFNSIRQRAPFYSTADIAPTKTLNFQEEGSSISNRKKAAGESSSDLPRMVYEKIDSSWNELFDEIRDWREEYQVDRMNISPWLVYKVFNKVFSQVANNDYFSNGMKDVSTALDIAGKAFYGTWSAFGSFEKGEVFGLPPIVANTNINTSRNFETNNEHFSQNILPFSPRYNSSKSDSELRDKFGRNSKSVTHALSGHPLRKWLAEVLEVDWPQSENNNPPKKSNVQDYKKAIAELLQVNSGKRFTETFLLDRMNELNWSKTDYQRHINKLKEIFNETQLNAFIKAGEQLGKNGSD